MTGFHLQMTLGFARQYIKNNPNSKVFLEGTHVMSDKKALNWINRLEKDGFKLIPCCENINSEGKCLGVLE